MDNPIDGTDSKLGHGFTSVDELEETDIGSGDRPRPTYVSAKLDPEYKRELIDLLKDISFSNIQKLPASAMNPIIKP